MAQLSLGTATPLAAFPVESHLVPSLLALGTHREATDTLTTDRRVPLAQDMLVLLEAFLPTAPKNREFHQALLLRAIFHRALLPRATSLQALHSNVARVKNMLNLRNRSAVYLVELQVV